MDSIIRVENVHYAYASETQQPVPALQGIDLTVRRGEYLVILGHNGSGKSTLARHLNGLLLPDSGTVWVEGWRTSEPAHRRQIRSTVGMVFQNPDNQIVATIVEEDVAFGPENLAVPPEEIRQRVDQALERVGMSEFRHRAPHLLSRGQKQRVCIAGVLAIEPRVLVLDESTAMLDPAGRRQVLDLAHRLNREHGITVVAITHHMEEAVEADRIVVLSQGKVALEGTPREVFSQPEQLRALQVGVPQITRLAHQLHSRNRNFPAGILTIEDFVGALAQHAHASSPAKTSDVPESGAPPEPLPGRERRRADPSASDAETAIFVEELEHEYLRGTPLRTKALNGLSMQVKRGEILGIIGPTGSGKSTLVQHFNGLLRPHGGRVLVFGRDSREDRQAAEIRRRVGFVFQQAEAQLFEHYVGDDVAYGPRNWKLPRDQVRERVRKALEAVGLGFEEFKDRLTFGLSGGQMRRVALAGVLALEPETLVLDEPTAGLDPAGRRQLMGNLLELHRERGLTLVLVSHDMEELARVCDRIAVVHQGRLADLDRPARVFAQADRLRAIDLAPPAVTEAIDRVRRLGIIPQGEPVLTAETAMSVLQGILFGAPNGERE